MDILFWIIFTLIIIILIFGSVIFFGAPYLPTLETQRKAALKLLDLQSGQTLVELGSGDGTMLIEAAKKGIKVTGYELNPILVVVSYWRTRKYRENVTIIWGDYWHKIWPRTDAIYTFLLDRYMKKLDKKIIQNYPEQKIKLASFAFKIPDKDIVKESQGIYLYEYDAQKQSAKEEEL